VDFQEADRRYVEIKRRHEAGELAQEEFEEQLKQLMVQDEEGRWWAKSRRSGEWHYHDGNRWVRETPPHYGEQHQQQAELPETFIKKLVEICARYSGSRFYVGEAIPKEKSDAAYKFFPIPNDERVFALIDNSNIFVQGVGLALSEKGIYWTMRGGRDFLTWQEFSTVPISEHQRSRDYIIRMGEGKEFVGKDSTMSREAAVQLLREIQSLIKASPAGSET
jgi:hypothetical protein